MGTAEERHHLSLWLYGLAVLAFVTFAWTPGSTVLVPQPGGLPTGFPFTRIGSAIGLVHASTSTHVAAVLGSSLLVTIAYLYVLQQAWRDRVSWISAGLACVATHVLVLLGPVVYSRDVFSYAMYGRIASIYGQNPYQVPPSAFSVDPLFAFVGSVWRHAVPVYGPASTWYGILITKLWRDPAPEITWFQLVTVLASLATVAFIGATTLRLAPQRSAFAIAAYGLSPVVPLLSVASAHNDVFLSLTAAAGVWLFVAHRQIASIVVLTIGTLVKLTGGVALLLGLAWCIGTSRGAVRRRQMAGAAVAILATTTLLTAPFVSRSDPTLGQLHLLNHEGWLAIQRVIRIAMSAFLGDSTSTIVVRWVFLSALIVSILWVAFATMRRASEGADVSELAAACGVGLLLTILLIPANLPWYAVWALPFVWAVPRRSRIIIIGLACVQFLSLPVADEVLFPRAFEMTARIANDVLAPAMIIAAGAVAIDIFGRLRSPARCLLDEALVPPVTREPSPEAGART